MRITFQRITEDRHALEIARPDGSRERVECETRSCLVHDLLHYAVESEARLDGGFWGRLAAGTTLAEMNDRTGRALGAYAAAEMAALEQIVGALSEIVKGRPAAELVAGMRRFAASLGTTMPDWLTEALVEAVRERMRHLTGHWRATPFGAVMELDWPRIQSFNE